MIRSLLVLLAAFLSAQAQASQIVLNPATLTFDDTKPQTPFTIALKTKPQDTVHVYYEAPNTNFDKCEVIFTPANWNQPQTVNAIPLPYFTNGFPQKTAGIFMAKAANAADQTTFATNGTLSFDRSTTKGATCVVMCDPHWHPTFDGANFDVMILNDCINLVVSDHLVVQVGLVRLNNAVTIIRCLAIAYNGNVYFFHAEKAPQAANPATFPTSGITAAVKGNPDSSGFTLTASLSDGSTITASNSMKAADGHYALDVTINLATHYKGQVKGTCGNYDGNAANDYAGADGKQYPATKPTVWQPDADVMGNTWVCTTDLNLFSCADKCTGIPKPNLVPVTQTCQIAVTLAQDKPPPPPPGYQTTPPQTYQQSPPPAPVTIPPPPPAAPNLVPLIEAACNKAFAHDANCRDKFLPQDSFLSNCLADSKTIVSTDVVNGLVSTYLTQLGAITAPLIQNPKDPNYQSAIACRQAQGLGAHDCPSNCNGANGACTDHGCQCAPGWTGPDCGSPLPGSSQVAAVPPPPPPAQAPAPAPQAPAPAPVPAGPVATPIYQSFPCDLSSYTSGPKPYTWDGCHTVSGDPGIFDGDGDAQKVTTSTVKVCKDRNPPAGKSTVYCMNCPSNAKGGAHMTCTGDDTANDNVFSPTCSAGYLVGTAPCYPSDPNTPQGPGNCANKNTPFAGLGSLEKPPCDNFPNYGANVKSFYCIGSTGCHLLMCPDNKITACSNGCYGKFDQNNQPCGKAACAAGSTAMTFSLPASAPPTPGPPPSR